MTENNTVDSSGATADAALEALRKSQQQLLLFITQAPLSIAMFDRDMRYLAASARWVQDYGRGFSDVTGRSHYDVLPDLPEVWKGIHQRGLSGETIKNDEDLWVQADGSKHWLRWIVTPWRDVHGEIGGIMIATENITGRKEVELALRESEEHFRTLFEQTTDGILVTDANGRFVDANTAACRQLGYPREELLMLTAANIVLPEDIERLTQEITRLTGEGGGVIRTEWKLRRKDGSIFFCEVTAKKLPDGRLQAFLRDVTEARHSQALLQERQYFLQQVLDAEPGTVYIFDLATRSNVYVNRHWLTAYGYSPDETTAMGSDLLTRIFSADDLARITAHHAAWRSAGEGEVREIDYQVRSKGGEWHWLHSRETAFTRDAAGQVTQILGIAHDVTESRQTEATLSKQTRMLSESQHMAHLGSWSVQLATGKITWSAEAYRIYGVSPETYSHDIQKYFDLVHPDDRTATRQQFERLVSGLPMQAHEFRIIRPDGAVRTLVGIGSFRMDAESRPVEIMGTVQDITERKHFEVENRRLELRLQQAQKMEAIGQLTAGIAHDFNNILASVLGYTRLALDHHVPDKDSELGRYLREVQVAGLRARDLVANMLAFSRARETKRQTILAASVATEVARMLAPTIPASIEFTTRVESDNANVLADPVQLHQVIMNLVINARDALAEHGRIELTVRPVHGVHATCAGCHADVRGDFVEIAVSDDGPGIPPDILTRVFDPFFTTKGTGLGTGMGLSVVHGVVHDCGGHVVVNSTPETGTAMRVLLPMADFAADVRAVVANLITRESTDHSHILVVDDEEVLARLIGEVLQTRGYRATVVDDSRQALDRFNAAPGEFDAVVSDQTMPGLTGIELAQSIRAVRPALPIILCTGYSAALNASIAADLGVALLDKPISFEVLLLTLEKLLSAARADAPRPNKSD